MVAYKCTITTWAVQYQGLCYQSDYIWLKLLAILIIGLTWCCLLIKAANAHTNKLWPGGWLTFFVYVQICLLRVALLDIQFCMLYIGSLAFVYQYSYSMPTHNKDQLQGYQLSNCKHYQMSALRAVACIRSQHTAAINKKLTLCFHTDDPRTVSKCRTKRKRNIWSKTWLSFSWQVKTFLAGIACLLG